MKCGGLHCDGCGGGNRGAAAALVVVVVFGAMVAGTVATAIGDLLEAVFWAAATVLTFGVAAVVAYLTVCARHRPVVKVLTVSERPRIKPRRVIRVLTDVQATSVKGGDDGEPWQQLLGPRPTRKP